MYGWMDVSWYTSYIPFILCGNLAPIDLIPSCINCPGQYYTVYVCASASQPHPRLGRDVRLGLGHYCV